ncbi:MAG: tripartite tricarboxylate transporter TctB family protein [candidate division NC10 bacterium]|nr:tripartite tricarboxylate transporter TctB family protein [candidate division NC10 bacterium]
MDPEREEQFTSLFLTVFSAGICFSSYHIGIGTLHVPGSGFFPFWGGIALGLLSLANFLVATTKRRRAIRQVASSRNGVSWKNLLLTFAFLFAYPVVLNLFGFPLSTFVFFFLFLRVIEPQKWSIVLGLSAAAALLTYAVFQYSLKVQFPAGIFGF